MSNSLITWVEIRPKEFDIKGITRLEFLHELTETADRVVSEYNKTTVYWKNNRPVFTRKVHTNYGGNKELIGFDVYTDNPVYKFIDFGVKGHVIQPGPKEEGPKGTWGTYKAGSLPGTLQVDRTGGTKVIGSGYLSLNQVINWPGIEARRFTELIKEKLESDDYDIRGRMQEAMNRAAARIQKGAS